MPSRLRFSSNPGRIHRSLDRGAPPNRVYVDRSSAGIMRRSFTRISNANGLVASALLGALLSCLASEVALSDPRESVLLKAATPDMPSCDSDDVVVFQSNPFPLIGLPCDSHRKILMEASASRAYLVETARPGYTMIRQGPELAIGRLHPAFVVRLANTIREARGAGLASAGVFSAYRPPAFGIGGFVDKFHSLHTYGLAVDVYGIGGPGTPEAQLWHDIAAKHGVICPYGPRNPAEWNHCQPTRVKIILAENPLRETVTAEGPISLEGMFEMGTWLIAGSTAVPTTDQPALVITAEQRAATTRLKSPLPPQAGTETAHNPSARKGRSPFRGVAFSLPQLARPPAIYVEEGQRSERSITLVQLMPRSASRSASRPQKSSSRY